MTDDYDAHFAPDQERLTDKQIDEIMVRMRIKLRPLLKALTPQPGDKAEITYTINVVPRT